MSAVKHTISTVISVLFMGGVITLTSGFIYILNLLKEIWAP